MMKAKILILLVLAVIINSCNKDKYGSKPQLTFKSVSTTFLQPQEIITFDMELTEGTNVSQDTIWIQQVTKNCAASNFTQGYPVPSFPTTKNLKATYEITYAYGIGLGYPSIQTPSCGNHNDTCVYKFWTKDVKNNYSDTIVSPIIVISQ